MTGRIVVLAASLLLAAGCGGDGDSLEEQNERRMHAGQVVWDGLEAEGGMMLTIECAEADEARFDCVAEALLPDKSARNTYAVSVTCDQAGCLWRGAGASGTGPPLP